MVRGLGLFKAHFKNYSEHYVLIGGTASTLALEEAGLDFRATKDLDIVLCIEALNEEFVRVFWEFIKAGGYRNRQKSTGRKLFYRFYDPEEDAFPVMLELFSRKPDALKHELGGNLTPVPMNDEVSSLSAILLDDGYYRFIHEHKREIDGIPIVTPECLIPLKARAWMDLSDRKNAGESIDERDIRKHRNDVFRLFRILDADQKVAVPDGIKNDLQYFLMKMASEASLDLRNLGIRTTTKKEVLENIRTIFGING
ncbi:MAG TPA: hypothetical protein PKH14_04315 [Syntrophorhabdus sp.]|nr:hypothetical protein [Syntrophorhabdus sp.]